MSKKSRKRNKRLLMLAALAGGAAMMGRGKGAVSTVGQPVGVNRMSTNTPPIGGTDHIKKAIIDKAAADAAAPIRTDIYKGSGKKLSDSGQIIGAAGVDSAGLSRGQLAKRARLSAMNRVPPSMRGGAIHAQGYTPRVPTGNIGKIEDLQYPQMELLPHMDMNYSDSMLILLQALVQQCLVEQVI